MVEIGGSELKFCPYWRKVARVGNHALVLCGAESVNAPPLDDSDVGIRLATCPYFEKGGKKAYSVPAILRFDRVDGEWRRGPKCVVYAPLSGDAGIRMLEERWLEAVRNFRKEIANLST